MILFVKAPIAGEVKTRLIPYLSGTEAADLYKCFVSDVFRTAQSITDLARTQVAYQPHPKASDLHWLGLKNHPDMFRQEGRSLGERLIHAFGSAFGRGAKHVVIIGSDSPDLPAAYIEQAFAALHEADVVLGPTVDGGYYLVGLSRPCLRLFEDVSWSTDQVFERTSQNAEKNGYTLRILPSHFDVDTFEDLQKLHNQLSQNNGSAPTTFKFLAPLMKGKSLQPIA